MNTGRRFGEVAAIALLRVLPGLCHVFLVPRFLAKMEGSCKLEVPSSQDLLYRRTGYSVMSRRNVKRYLDLLDPAVCLRYSPRLWLFRKSAVSCLVRDNIKASFVFAPRLHAGGSGTRTKVPVHDLRELACSYSRKYLDSSKGALAKRVGSKTFSTLN